MSVNSNPEDRLCKIATMTARALYTAAGGVNATQVTADCTEVRRSGVTCRELAAEFSFCGRSHRSPRASWRTPTAICVGRR